MTKYYFAGASRIAVRKYIVPQSSTLTYLAGDHLGSTSLAVDASTGEVIQTRYKPCPLRDTSGVLREGEVRYTTPSKTLPTRYTFTGQYSYVSDDATDLGAAGFGLMFYNARWYDHTTGRFAQADTIVPGGVQGLDRYAYVANNPIVYTDPSGHAQYHTDNWWSRHGSSHQQGEVAPTFAGSRHGICYDISVDGTCNDPTGLEGLLLHEFGWIMDGNDWHDSFWKTSKYLLRVLLTGRDILRYVNKLSGGKGQQWMDKYMSGITFTVDHGNGRSHTNGVHVWVMFTTLEFESMAYARYEIAHELGHVWDYHTGNYCTDPRVRRGNCGGFENGVGDSLNHAIGGDIGPGDSRGDNPDDPNYVDPNIPTDALWVTPLYYGNGSTADYLADAFAYGIYGGNIPQYASLWVPVMITIQASYLQ